MPQIALGVVGKLAHRQPPQRLDPDGAQCDQDERGQRVASRGHRRPHQQQQHDPGVGAVGHGRIAQVGGEVLARRGGAPPGPANQVPTSSSSPTVTTVMLAAASRSVATHQIAWAASRLAGIVVSESISASPTTRRMKISTTPAASTPMAIARSVFRRSREITAAIASTASAASASGIDSQPQQLHPGLGLAQLLGLKQRDLARARRQRDRTVGARTERARELRQDGGQVDRHRPVGGVEYPGVVEDLHQLVVGPEIGAPPQLHRPRAGKAGRHGALQIRLGGSGDRCPKAASAEAEASGSAPPGRRRRHTAGRPDTPTPRCAPPAAASALVLVSDQVVESSATRSTQVAKTARHSISDPSATSAPMPSLRRLLFPVETAFGLVLGAAFCDCSTSLIDPPFAWRSASS